MTRPKLVCIWAYFFLVSCSAQEKREKPTSLNPEWELKEDDWRERLTEFEYYVIREKGTERAFTGKYWDNKNEGTYTCKACNLPLFDSKAKYKSGTGWPSFFVPLDEKNIKEESDYLLGYKRTEVLCSRCGGHLGHVFPDGPEPTGLRYCLNSISLNFKPLATPGAD